MATSKKKAPVQEVPRNPAGGSFPPGYGADRRETFMWEPPQFQRHPLTGKMEAVNWGLFFRLWPEHVRILLNMKKAGWAHSEIIRVAGELWKRQEKEYKKQEELVDHMDQHRQEAQKDQSTSLYETPGETYKSQNGNNGNGVSLESLEPKPVGGLFEEPAVLESRYQEKLSRYQAAFAYPVRGQAMGGLRIVIKGDTTGGERTLTPQEEQEAQKQTWTRKRAGVLNSAPAGLHVETAAPARDAGATAQIKTK